MVSKVFVILIGSILAMLLMDSVMLVVKVVSVHSRVSAIMSTVQTEVSRNNHMPEDMGNAFTLYLKEIAATSGLMDETRDVKTNFASVLTIDSTTYDSLIPQNAGNYGDIIQVAVHLDLHPLWLTFNSARSDSDPSFLNRVANNLVIGLDYVYSVPCLRYLK